MVNILSIPLNVNIFSLRIKQDYGVDEYEEKEVSHKNCANSS